LLFIIVGWQFIDPANYVPYIPENTGVKGQFGWSGIAAGAGTVFLLLLVLMRFRLQHKKQNPKRYAYWNLRVSSDLYDTICIVCSHDRTCTYYLFANDAKPAATAFAVTGYDFLQTGLIVAILMGYTLGNACDVDGTKPLFYTYE
jgi:APA family basic amino acid/polyamine antiporter